MMIPNFISKNFNNTYQYLRSPDGLLVSLSCFSFFFVHSFSNFNQSFEDRIETTIVGFCLSIVVVLLYYLIRRSQARTRCKYNSSK